MKRLAAAILLALALGACDNEVPILLYHWVGAGTDMPWDMSAEQFRAHMDEIGSLGYTTVTLDQLYDALDGRGRLPSHPLVITFDDGEEGVYRHALPILRERGMCAELFLVEGFVRDDPAERYRWTVGEAQLSMLLWSEVREMADSGVIRIESHSQTHPQLAKIPIEEARREIAESRRLLAERLGRPIDFFAYPAHSLGSDVMSAVEQAGYRGAVAGKNRLGSRYAMWRTSIFSSDGVEELRHKLSRNWADSWVQ